MFKRAALMEGMNSVVAQKDEALQALYPTQATPLRRRTVRAIWEYRSNAEAASNRFEMLTLTADALNHRGSKSEISKVCMPAKPRVETAGSKCDTIPELVPT